MQHASKDLPNRFLIFKNDLPLLILQLSLCIKEQFRNNSFTITELEISREVFFSNK